MLMMNPTTMATTSTAAPTITGTMGIHSGVISGESLTRPASQKFAKRVQ